MDSEEEFLSFSDAEKPSPPDPERKLKRLKKASVKVYKLPLPNPSNDDEESFSNLETLDSGENIGEDFEEPNARFPSQRQDFEDGNDLDSGFDGVGFEQEGGSGGVKRALEFDSVDEELDEVEDQDRGEQEGIGEVRLEDGAEKKQRSLDELEKNKEEKKKKKKKRSKIGGDGYDEKLHSPVPNRRENKGRKQRLMELRVESQRLLRETRDASFKPVPLVQKPVSSILERIRQRKFEVSRKFVAANTSPLDDANDVFSRKVTLDFDFEDDPLVDIEDHRVANVDSKKRSVGLVDTENSLDAISAQGSEDTANCDYKNSASQMALNEESKQTFRPPVDDTQDLSFDSQTSDSSDEMPSSPLEEVLAPSLLSMNLKVDSVTPEDSSSDEEDNDKENIDPCLHGSASPKGDPVKDFVDDEAEEEDDSDNDLGRFQDNEEDDDQMDSDELNDTIATGYKEKPIDNEMRNELHQKWLEQQDAAGTENLLQRLKFGSKVRETTLLEEKEDDDDEEDEEQLPDEAAEDIPLSNIVRMNLKKAKEMIPEMFTDKDDVYLSSDDEVTEKRLLQQLSDKAEEHAAFLSPEEDAGSKEIFGLIKKLNVVPDTRKKAKITSYFHMLSMGGTRTMPLKSSFVGRGSNSLPSFRKHGSSAFRSFVFERDDSNSRSAISMSEDSSNLIQGENKPRKIASAKFCNSQIRSSTQNSQTAAETKSGPSLHEILRCPPPRPNHGIHDRMVGQVEAVYASFKLDHSLIKKQSSITVRTV